MESGGKTSEEDLFSSHPATEERKLDLEARIGHSSVEDRSAQRTALHAGNGRSAAAVIGALLGNASAKLVKWAAIEA